MKILLTNDDGIKSQGLKKIYAILNPLYDLTVVAPQFPQSGKSSSLSISKPMEVNRLENNIYMLSGTPVDCVKFAFKNISAFDLVISGANNGLNVGHDVIYSGTVGAAFEGNLHNAKAIAVSCQRNDFEIIDKTFLKVFNYLIDNNLLDSNHILNINFPKVSQGIKKSYLYDIKHHDLYTKDHNTYALNGYFSKEVESGSDLFDVNSGYVSITKLQQIKSVPF